MTDSIGDRFDRIPQTDAERNASDRPTRREILEWWENRFGIGPSTFSGYTFWERGAGKIWAFYGTVPSPIPVEGLGITFLRTGHRHWKPTTNAIQRFGSFATKNVIHVDRPVAERFVAGQDQAVEWDGEWGYLIVATELAGTATPLGVGLYIDGVLRSTVPKGRRRTVGSESRTAERSRPGGEKR